MHGAQLTDAASTPPLLENRMTKPPIINIQMVPAGVELVLAALNKLPREQSDPLYQEILGQYVYQMSQHQKPESQPDVLVEAEAE
jgi:hypothetical protein